VGRWFESSPWFEPVGDISGGCFKSTSGQAPCRSRKHYEGRTWPTDDGFAYIICHDCGERDEKGRFFEKNTVYTTRGDFTDPPDERCNVCKGYGFLGTGPFPA